MYQNISIIKISFIVLLLFVYSFKIYAQGDKGMYDSIDIYTSKFQWATDKIKEYPEESYVIFKECIPFYASRKDTFLHVSCLINMLDIARSKGEYALTFDFLWESLHLSMESNKMERSAVIHRKLSGMYDLYGMYDLSMKHLQNALNLSKEIYANHDNRGIQLSVSYLNMAMKKRNAGKYHEALALIDSCEFDQNMLKYIPWFPTSLELERAKSLLETNRFADAMVSIQKARISIDGNEGGANSILKMRMGEYFQKTGNIDSAIYYYTESLRDINNKEDARKAEVYRKMANIYEKQQRYYLAYFALKSSKELTDSITEARISTNSEIFKINNSYQERIQEKDALIEARDATILNEQAQQQRLKIIIALLLLLIIAILLVIRMRYKLRKTLLDKKSADMEALLEKQQTEKEIHMKSQELTAYALQLVDKETHVKELLQSIKKLSPEDHKKLERKYKSGIQSIWDEFNKRFTEVNTDFYERLSKKCPDLSRTEQKHCALIKLNFSTKEMAQILNVEGHTINMSRSRIRKKIGLTRDENLSKYIGEL